MLRPFYFGQAYAFVADTEIAHISSASSSFRIAGGQVPPTWVWDIHRSLFSQTLTSFVQVDVKIEWGWKKTVVQFVLSNSSWHQQTNITRFALLTSISEINVSLWQYIRNIFIFGTVQAHLSWRATTKTPKPSSLNIFSPEFMGVGRGGGRGGLGPPWILKLLAKEYCFFFISRGKKQISPLLATPGKILEKFPSGPPLEKILPTPMSVAYLFTSL